MKTINDPSYELKGDERDIYEHSLLEAEIDKMMKRRAIIKKLHDLDIEDLQPGETKCDLDFDYQNFSGR